jgi:hypothetical protein
MWFKKKQRHPPRQIHEFALAGAFGGSKKFKKELLYSFTKLCVFTNRPLETERL